MTAGHTPLTTDTVQYCPICRTKTWHLHGVCEWADGHQRIEQARRDEREHSSDDSDQRKVNPPR